MKRRAALLSAAAAAAGWAVPRPASAATDATSTLRFVPQTDLASLDPVFSTPTVTRNHAFLVYDFLYGLDAQYRPQPQMLDRHSVEQGGLVWRLFLRDGLQFHDGQPVLARDAVASIRRWAARDPFGSTLMQRTDQLTAEGDREIRFRLKQPFPLLPDALGKLQPPVLAIMPERLASLDPSKAISEVVGSGPFRFLPSERVAGASVAYEKFAGYVPRPDGPVGLTSGPKRALVDRVEWVVMPEASTAAAALQTGEVDWWEQPYPDLVAQLRQDAKLAVELKDRDGSVPVLRFNCTSPPFDKAAIRRAVIGAIDRREVMAAVAGDDRSMWNDRIGVFTPGSPLATDAGLERFDGPRDLAAARRALHDAGYAGEKVVLLQSTDIPANSLSCDVVADTMKRIGMTVDLQAMDYGTLAQRRTSHQPADKGGWSAFITRFDGITLLNPAVALFTRANGNAGWYGWPDIPSLEALYAKWLQAPDLDAQRAVCRDIQLDIWNEAPAFPLGQILLPAAYSRRLKGVSNGFPKFYNVTKT